MKRKKKNGLGNNRNRIIPYCPAVFQLFRKKYAKNHELIIEITFFFSLCVRLLKAK